MTDVRAEHDIAIRWRRLDRRGWEEARLSRQRLTGRARFEHEGEECALDYDIELTPTWETVRAHVVGHVGGTPIEIAIAVTEGRWTMQRSDGLQPVGGRAEARPYVRCIDLDLKFTHYPGFAVAE
ncbi:MAG TPA: putative glycolipid-binding domain-containing protein [Thermoanaerobaculia bacterium]|nr:putative glycolipid-binding domain-containing protein [Thermoanaerobaculia bacterium]